MLLGEVRVFLEASHSSTFRLNCPTQPDYVRAWRITMRRMPRCPRCGCSTCSHLHFGARIAELLALREWAAGCGYADKVDEIDLELHNRGVLPPANDNNPGS